MAPYPVGTRIVKRASAGHWERAAFMQFVALRAPSCPPGPRGRSAALRGARLRSLRRARRTGYYAQTARERRRKLLVELEEARPNVGACAIFMSAHRTKPPYDPCGLFCGPAQQHGTRPPVCCEQPRTGREGEVPLRGAPSASGRLAEGASFSQFTGAVRAVRRVVAPVALRRPHAGGGAQGSALFCGWWGHSLPLTCRVWTLAADFHTRGVGSKFLLAVLGCACRFSTAPAVSRPH